MMNNSTNNKATLFLGDLSTFCTERDIHMAFSPYGEILEIKIMRSEETFRNLSYGFIKFAHPGAAKKAMNGLNGVLFCGRNLRIGWASYKNKKEPKTALHHDRIESSSVHVSYISYQLKTLITEESLRTLFSQYGIVLDTSIKKSYIDESINRQCGYGFVHYSSTQEGIESALAAVAGLNDATLENVCYKCSISHNLEKYLLELQSHRIEQMHDNYRVSAGSPISVGDFGHLAKGAHATSQHQQSLHPANFISNDFDHSQLQDLPDRMAGLHGGYPTYNGAGQTDIWAACHPAQHQRQPNVRDSFVRAHSDGVIRNGAIQPPDRGTLRRQRGFHNGHSQPPQPVQDHFYGEPLRGGRNFGGLNERGMEGALGSGALKSFGLTDLAGPFGENSAVEVGAPANPFLDSLMGLSSDSRDRESFGSGFSSNYNRECVPGHDAISNPKFTLFDKPMFEGSGPIPTSTISGYSPFAPHGPARCSAFGEALDAAPWDAFDGRASLR